MENEIENIRWKMEKLEIEVRSKIENCHNICNEVFEILNDLEEITLTTIMREKLKNDKIIELEKEMREMTIKSFAFEKLKNDKITELEKEIEEIKALTKVVKSENKTKEVKESNVIVEKENKIFIKSTTNTKSEHNLSKMIEYKDDEAVMKTKTLVAIKGRNWVYNNIHSWLEKKLNLNIKDKVWTVSDIGMSTIHKKVEFKFAHDKEYIWQNKYKWDDEGIWKWEEYLTLKERQIRNKLLQFATELQMCGKRVQVSNKCIVADGEKWIWVEKVNEILKLKVAKFLEKSEEENIKKSNSPVKNH